jgi:phage shock protein PspC (stress-responsive transcriptional regulator)
MAPDASGGPSSRRMDETPTGSGHDVERELRARVAVEDEAELDPEWPSPSRPGRPPLRRRAQGKWVAGVAGGLADHWGVPALVLRIPLAIAVVVAASVLWNAITGHGGLLESDGLPGLIVVASLAATVGYGVLWLVLPLEDVVRSPARQFGERYPRIRSVPGLVALAIGGAILADRLGIWQPDLVLAAGLIALGLWLFRRDRAVSSEPRSSERPPQGVVTVEGAAPPTAPAITRQPRERSPLGWITFGVALLVVCVAAIWTSLAADTLSTINRAVGFTRISTIPAVGLLVLAAGLLLGCVFGRARWLILPALLVVPVMLVASVVRLPFEGAFGNSYLRAHDLVEREVATQRRAMGSIYVDLSRFQGRPEVERELQLSTVVGTVSVVVPFDAHVRIEAFTGLGTIGFGPRSTYGLEVSDSATLEPRHGDGPTFTVHVEVGLGDVYVYRYSPTKRELHELRRDERLAERRAERTAEREAAA